MNGLISLVLPVVNRYSEVFIFLENLKRQSYSNYEVIIVDQGKGIDYDKLLSYEIPIKYKHVDFASSSIARNYGLKFSEGEYVGFPDDDCVYQSSTLLNCVFEFFKNNPEENCLVVDRIDHFEHEVPYIPDYKKPRLREINKGDFLSIVTGWNFFIRMTSDIKKYNEELGISERNIFGAGEDVDFVISNFGFDLKFLKNIYVSHPTLKKFSKDQEVRYFKYAMGLGAILKEHFGFRRFLIQVMRSSLGMCFSILRFDFLNFRRYRLIVWGVMKGYFLWKK